MPLDYGTVLAIVRQHYGPAGRAKASGGPGRTLPVRKRLCRVGFVPPSGPPVTWTGHGTTWRAALLDAGIPVPPGL